MDKAADSIMRGKFTYHPIIDFVSLSTPSILLRTINSRNKNRTIKNDHAALFKTFLFLIS
jgi:hypothetical protein